MSQHLESQVQFSRDGLIGHCCLRQSKRSHNRLGERARIGYLALQARCFGSTGPREDFTA